VDLSTGGSGTIVGPISSTDNSIARWNGITGTIIQNSEIMIDDDNNITIGTLANNIYTIDTPGAIRIKSNVFADGLYVQLEGSDGITSNSTGGFIGMYAGNATLGNAEGGDIDMAAGNGVGSSSGGDLTFGSGVGGATGIGGFIVLTAGNGGATSGGGGGIEIRAGNATNGGSNGGDILIDPGNKNGAGTDGKIRLNDPTSNIDAILSTASLATTDKTFTFPNTSGTFALTGLAGTKVYYVSDTSGGAVTRKLTFTDGILTSET